MIKETFLHFIWKLQYFHKQNLTTTQGEAVQILHQGTLNTDAGPDFLNARIKIGNLEWFGTIEIHLNSSDWELHQHQHNEAYNNVILHVVWADDQPVLRDNGLLVPTIELKNRISEALILKYSSIVNNKEPIPCSGHLESVSSLKKISMIDRAVVERLEARRSFIQELVRRNKGDWQESAYQLVAKNFGFKLNAEPFLRLAYSTPLKTLLWHRKNLFQLEAVLLGQSGLLDDRLDEGYPLNLKKEYEFLSNKLSFNSSLKKSEWKFLRIRPANFPTLRIAEFAALVHTCPDFFTSIVDFKSVKDIHKVLRGAMLSDYWKDHYVFNKVSDKKVNRQLGDDSIDNLVINTIVPFLYCMGKEKDQELYVERALSFLEEINAENNTVMRRWNDSGLRIYNAYDSQGALELYNNYCARKSCLDCEIGVSILSHKEVVRN